jgi:hypothetical protein
MPMHRILTITVLLLLEATIGCHKRVIAVSPYAYPFASPGDYLEFRKATPGIQDFVVVFSGQSPCGAVTSISVIGTKPGGCKVVTPSGGSVTYSSSYEIYFNSPDRSIKSAIAKPTTWPKDFPFNVVPCRICGSEVTVQGSSSNPQAVSVSEDGKATPQSKVDDPPPTSSQGAISCPNGAASVTPVSASISRDGLAIWQENGPNLGWTITNFAPSFPCQGTKPISNDNASCFLSGPPGSYTFDINVTSCTSQPTGSGQLTVTQ